MHKTLACITILAFIPVAGGQEALHTNAYFWKGLSAPAKLTYVEAYTAGFDEGALEFRDAALKAGLTNDKAESIRKAVTLGGLFYDQLVHGVDECYSDFRNEHLEISDCITWVHWGIQGASDDGRKKLLENLRRESLANALQRP